MAKKDNKTLWLFMFFLYFSTIVMIAIFTGLYLLNRGKKDGFLPSWDKVDKGKTAREIHENPGSNIKNEQK